VTTAKSTKQRRKRCLNDNKLFVPARNVPDQKFCCDKCRKEFWTHGSAFGPMKLGLYSAIDKKYAALFRETTRRFVDERKREELRFQDLERKIASLAIQIANVGRDIQRETEARNVRIMSDENRGSWRG
jgi:hypothetical protein